MRALFLLEKFVFGRKMTDSMTHSKMGKGKLKRLIT